MLLLCLNIGVGLWVGDYNLAARELVQAQKEWRDLEEDPTLTKAERDEGLQKLTSVGNKFKSTQPRQMMHMMLGIGASLFTVLVNSIAITYFIGTSKWCGEVVHAYHLDSDFNLMSKHLKKRCFPWSLGATFLILIIAAMGAAADPAGNINYSQSMVMPHFLIALLGTALIGLAFVMQYIYVGKNFDLIQDIMTEVKRIQEKRKGNQHPLPAQQKTTSEEQE